MSNKNKVNMQFINKENDKFNKKNEVPFRDMTIMVDAKPSQYKINKLIADYEKVLNEVQANVDIDLKNLDALMEQTVRFLMIKLFTDVPVPSVTNVENILMTLEKFVNVGLIEALYTSKGFRNEEYEKLATRIFKTMIDPKKDYYNLSATIAEMFWQAGLVVMNNPIFMEENNKVS